MTPNWYDIILESKSSTIAWSDIFLSLLSLARRIASPIALHDETVVPDRLLSEAAWDIWEAFPSSAPKTSQSLKEWTNQGSGKAVLIIDALSLRELSILLGAAEARGIKFSQVKVTGSECPSTTECFAKALGLPSRSALANDGKPRTFSLFKGICYTDVVGLPFEDCTVTPSPNVVIWHTWLDDLIHLQQKLPDQITKTAATVFQSDGFWKFVRDLRQGRSLVITSDHGYAVSKRFSSEVVDVDAVEALRNAFGASRNKTFSDPWKKGFMPPIVMAHNNHYVIMGQRKWKVQGGFPHACHGGMSLLEVAVPYMELPAL